MREYDKPLIELTFYLKINKRDVMKTKEYIISEKYLVNFRNELKVKLTQEYLIIDAKDYSYVEKYIGCKETLRIPVDSITEFSIEKSQLKDHLTLKYDNKVLNLWRANLVFDNLSLNMKRKINYIQEYNKRIIQQS